MTVFVGKGSFKGFAESVRITDVSSTECSTEQCISNKLQKISRNKIIALSTYNTDVQQLRKMVDSVGTSMDSHELRTKMSAIQSETTQMTQNTNIVIKLYADAPSFDDKQVHARKLQHRRFNETFGEILKAYNEQQKVIRIKERHCIRSSLMKSGCYDIDIDDAGCLVKDGEQIQAEAIQAEIDVDLMKDREKALQQLEQDIHDVNDIFQDLAGMVQDQGELIAEAEDNVDVAILEVETAVQELYEAVEYKRASRRKVCIIIIGVAIVVVALLTIVVAVVTSKSRRHI